MTNYFCAKISQEHSENIQLMALNLGVPKENIVFSTVGCEFCTLGIYIKFQSQETLRDFTEESAPFILEKW